MGQPSPHTSVPRVRGAGRGSAWAAWAATGLAVASWWSAGVTVWLRADAP